MAKVYGFREQLEIGKKYERDVDKYLIEQMDMSIIEVSLEYERIGIDRVAISNKTRAQMTIEIKSDTRGQDTGNAFIETVSVERDGKIEKYGWIRTSSAQVLIYYLPLIGQLIFVDMPLLKRYFFKNSAQWKEIPIKNQTYTGYGKLMQLSSLRDLAFHIAKISHK